MPSRTNDQSALLGSRLCHDLISPLGAISNGLELLLMTGQPRSPEFMLISDSISAAHAQIRFFRISFGTADPNAKVSASECSDILTDYYQAKRLNIAWNATTDTKHVDVKIAFLIVLCLETVLPFGGQIQIDVNGQGFEIRAAAKSIKPLTSHWAHLTDDASKVNFTSAKIQFDVLKDLLNRHDTNFHVTETEFEIVVNF